MRREPILGTARVYIVDEHAVVREALAARLGQSNALEIIGHSGDPREVLPIVQSSKPDVVLVETKRSDGLGLEILRRVAALPCSPRVAVLTTYPTPWERDASRRAGAIAYLLKDIDSEELIRQISALSKE